MPPKKPTTTKTATKPATKAPAATGGTKSTGGAKTGGAKAGGAKGAGGAKAPPPVKAEEAPPKPKALPEISMTVKAIPDLLIDDVDKIMAKSPGWPYIVNISGVLSTFVKYRNINVLRVMDQHEMEAETIRKALLGALRYGKPFLIDMEDLDMFSAMTEFLDRVIPGLTEMLLTKKVLEPECIEKLIRKNDDDDYQRTIEYRTDTFCFAVLTKKAEVSEEVRSKMFVVKAD